MSHRKDPKGMSHCWLQVPQAATSQVQYTQPGQAEGWLNGLRWETGDDTGIEWGVSVPNSTQKLMVLAVKIMEDSWSNWQTSSFNQQELSFNHIPAETIAS